MGPCAISGATEEGAGNFQGRGDQGDEAVSRNLAAHFRPDAHPRNELPDKPVVIWLGYSPLFRGFHRSTGEPRIAWRPCMLA
jgi:hypothetical protein